MRLRMKKDIFCQLLTFSSSFPPLSKVLLLFFFLSRLMMNNRGNCCSPQAERSQEPKSRTQEKEGKSGEEVSSECVFGGGREESDRK